MISFSLELTFMISDHWLRQRKTHWEQMERLLDRCGKMGVKVLTRDELRDLGLHYRQIAADLSALREDKSGQVYSRYLNQLMGRAHNLIYTGSKTKPFSFLRFFTQDYPDVFRRNYKYTLAATIVFLAFGVVGVLLTLYQPDFALQVVGPHMVATIERHEMWTDSIVSMKPAESSAIMTNNLAVTFMTFAFGITGGLGTLYMMAFNGLLIGVVGTACWQNQMSIALWSFVAPHGVLELPAIFIAGGAGLLIGQGLLFPGVYSRKESVRIAGAEAIKLLSGTIPMLIVAGIIEGFISPTHIPPAFKFMLGGILFVLLVLYLSPRPAPLKKV